MITVLKIFHIGVAAAWFGHKLLVPSDIRHTLAGEGQAGHALLARLARAERLGILTGFGTLLTGLLPALAIGPSAVGIGIWVGLGLVVIAIALGGLIARPTSTLLKNAIGEGSVASARSHVSRLSVVLGAEAILWSAALVAMIA